MPLNEVDAEHCAICDIAKHADSGCRDHVLCNRDKLHKIVLNISLELELVPLTDS